MVRDAAAVLGVMEGDEDALAGCSEGAIWLQMSTIGVEGTRRCAQLAQGHGLSFVEWLVGRSYYETRNDGTLSIEINEKESPSSPQREPHPSPTSEPRASTPRPGT